MVFSDEDKIIIKVCIRMGSQQRGFTGEFPEKRWKKRGVNKLLKRCRTQAQFTSGQKFEFLISQGSVATRLR